MEEVPCSVAVAVVVVVPLTTETLEQTAQAEQVATLKA